MGTLSSVEDCSLLFPLVGAGIKALVSGKADLFWGDWQMLWQMLWCCKTFRQLRSLRAFVRVKGFRAMPRHLSDSTPNSHQEMKSTKLEFYVAISVAGFQEGRLCQETAGDHDGFHRRYFHRAARASLCDLLHDGVWPGYTPQPSIHCGTTGHPACLERRPKPVYLFSSLPDILQKKDGQLYGWAV